MEDVLKRIILENQKIISNKYLISRNYSIPKTEHIKVLTGIRRCGKTHILYQYAKKLNPEHVLFIDLKTKD